MKLGKQFRTFDVREAKTEKESRTLEFPFSSELPVERWFGNEILSHKKGAMDLARLKDGGALLWNHKMDTVIGVVESADLREDNRLWATVRFSENAKAQEVWKDIEDGILKNVSFGYQVKEMVLSKKVKGQPDEYTATKWMPFEVSIVSIPADHTVGIGRSENNEEIEVKIIKPEGAKKMDEIEKAKQEEAKRAADIKVSSDKAAELARENERARTKEILAIGEKHGKTDLARQFIDSGKGVEEMRAAVLELLGQKQTPVDTSKAVLGMTDKETQRFSIVKAIRAQMEPGNQALREEAKFEIEASEAAAKAAGKAARGIMVPLDVLRAGLMGQQRDMLAGTPSVGGDLVATNLLAGSFIDMLRNKMAIQQLGATVLNGLTGSVAIPRQAGGATAYWVGENGAVTESTQALDQVALNPKTIGAWTNFSRKLMLQSSVDVESFVRKDLASVLALGIDLAALYGLGSANQPLGLFEVGGINTVDFANSTPTYAEIIKMETEVSADNADIGNLAYITNALGRGGMKGTDKFSSAGSPVWEAGNTMNGYKAVASNQVKTLSSTDPDFFFGNWADLILGFWSGLDIVVDPYKYSTSGAIAVVALQDVDVAVRHPESFCYGNKTIS